MSAVKEIPIPYLPEKARVVTDENGFTFVFVPKQGDVFNISTWVKTGSIHEDDRISGISHFLEHLMFKGTERFGPGEFDKEMESMGAVINAATWKDFTFYYITGPKGRVSAGETGENFDRALDMHADMMLGSTLPDAEIGPPYDPMDPDYQGEKRERSVVIEEIGMREDEPWTRIYNAVNHLMYRDGHPYRRDVIGTRAIIGRLPRETLYAYYRRWYGPEHLTTIVVGDFDFEHLQEKVARSFDFKKFASAVSAASVAGNALPVLDGWAEKDAPEKSTVKSALEKARYQELSGDYQTTFFIMGFHGPKAADLRETIALDVASHVLGESRSSRLTQALLEKPAKPVYNHVSCGQSTFKLGNVFLIQGNFTSAPGSAPRTILGQLETEVERMLTTEPITADEFIRAVKKLRVDFAETSETASGIAEAIGEALTVTGELGAYLDYLSVLDGLDVETVNAVARRYLSLGKAYAVVMVPGGKQGSGVDNSGGE
jgi:zinc protease